MEAKKIIRFYYIVNQISNNIIIPIDFCSTLKAILANPIRIKIIT